MRPAGSSSSHGNSRSVNTTNPHQCGNAANNSRRGTSNNSNRGSRQNHRSNLPIEQGVIHTLLDKFGFIMCADRDKELFFHYSEFKEGHSDELNIGDEVEFRVGRAEERGGRRGGGGGAETEKWSAFDVRKLPKGTIYWEKEDEPVGKRWKGFVDQVAREDHPQRQRGGMRDQNSGGKEGVIRITDDDENKSNDKDENLEIYYTTSDYTPTRPSQNPSRLDRKDVLEFTLVTKRRTGKKYARNITLIQSERDRLREEREAKLLKDASLERGKVASIKGDFGFLRSTTRVEEVYFHISHIVPLEDANSGDDAATEGVSRGMLKEGQEVEFFVVDEAGGVAPSTGDGRGGRKGGKSVSARKIKVLPQGTVKFEHKIAVGVKGMVTDCPVASVTDPFGRRDDRRKNDRGVVGGGMNQKVGKIRLQEGIVMDNNNGEQEVITHVILPLDMYPGGTFAISRTGSEVGSWIRPGDVLLFDVVKKVIDGSCRAVPTKSLQVASPRPEEVAAAAVDKDDSSSLVKPSVRLIEPSLCGRAEGVIRSIHDNYGFIHLAERNVDAYFPLFEVFPAEIQGDLARNNPDVYHNSGALQNKGGRVHVEVGMEVSFDLSIQILSNASGGGRAGDRGRYGKQSRSSSQEKESLRARRVQILPKGTVKDKIAIAEGVKATVTKEDPKQPFVGSLQLEESLKVDSESQRHPLVVKLLDAICEGKYGEEDVNFHDVVSERDAQIFISMVNFRNDLEWSYIPENNAMGDNGNNHKLCIARKKIDGTGKEDSEQPITSTISLESAKYEASDEKEEAPLNEGNVEGMENNDVANMKTKTAAGVGGSSGDKKQECHKKKSKKAKIVKVLRFDKFSFPDMSIGPPGVGDVVTCNIFQSRRSGAMIVENITFIERKEKSSTVVSDGEDDVAATQHKSLSGFVTEVLPNRQFGFITAVDAQGSKTGEHVFFHFTEVEHPDIAQDGGLPSSLARGKKPGRSETAVIRKGDEVKFDARPGKNGKLTAFHVVILPRGTLKLATNKADNKSPSCTGYILMEPSHTSLANTPSHVVLQSGSSAAASGGGSRWDNVRDDKSASSMLGSNTKEGGVILLLSDPSHLFSPKPKVESPKKMDVTAGGESLSENNANTDASSPNGSDNAGIDAEESNSAKADKSNDNIGQGNTASIDVGMHLIYKTSSIIAARGFSAGTNNRHNDWPKRGDLVSFGKTRGTKLVKDIRVERVGAATTVKGVLTDTNKEDDTAVFALSDNDGARYDIKLTEVVSCDKSLLKDKEQVDGILHEGKIFGVCRTKDIYLASSFGRKSDGSSSSGGLKERPKLNLTVKKELQGMGGQIMAQSRMAKGPDGTNGFAPGWTTRVSPHAVKEDEPARSLSAAASEFIPNFPVIAASGFESVEDGRME